MSLTAKNSTHLGGNATKSPRDFITRFKSDTRGSTIIEFALLVIPFFYLVFSIISYGFYLFTNIALDAAAETAARDVRTGQAQNRGDTIAKFKEDVCTAGGAAINCNNIRVHVDSGTEWTEITAPSCTGTNSESEVVLSDGTQETDSDGNEIQLQDESGGAGEIFLMTLCYEFTMAQSLPKFMKLYNLWGSGTLDNGAPVIQSATTFRIEPYQD